MQMDLIIRKHTFSKEFNSDYFGDFPSLFSLDLESTLIDTIFTFLENAQNLKAAVRPLITDEEGYPANFFKSVDKSYGYTSLGFKDISIFENVMAPLPEYKTTIDSTNKLWNLLGWTMSEPKIVKVTVGNFNAETAMYEGYPKTFEEVDRLWTQ